MELRTRQGFVIHNLMNISLLLLLWCVQTKKDWEEVEKGPVGRRLDKEHHQLVTSIKSSFLENLKFPGGYLDVCCRARLRP